MKFSNFFISTFKENPSDAKLKSHILMLRSCMIKQETAGIYSWLPIGYRVLKKIINIVEVEHESMGINQILMPTIQSSDIWKLSDRYETYGKEMLKIIDRNNKELLYGPTNEEMMTSIGKHLIRSYKSLPRYFFHIQSKFRDEIRPRFGVMRAREFIMKDAYSFDKDESSGEQTYVNFYKLYLKIFKKLGLPIIPVKAPSGEIGGDLSHEFHLLVKGGESEIYTNKLHLSKSHENSDISQIKSIKSYTDDMYKKTSKTENLENYRSIELGHIFLFGIKYSKSFSFNINHDGSNFFPYMGSYGIGISRIPAAIIEYSNDHKGIIWPKEVAPFDVILIDLLSNNENKSDFCNNLYNQLKTKNIDVIYDDRLERAGIKFSDADLIGIPIQIIVGKDFKEKNQLSVKLRENNKEYSVLKENIIKHIEELMQK
jgi:prolyl-tRNA synthetase|tara:strand:+ start:1000 stop:2283 length:1284 start_codon:yes stop_codon:yes gene_type:complete